MSSSFLRRGRGAALLTPLFVLSCVTLQQFAALRDVEFALDRVSGIRLAGVALDGVDSVSNVNAAQLATIAAALATGRVPLEFVLDVNARNPESNEVDARLEGLDWTLLIEDRETVSGDLPQPVVLPPGEPRVVPLAIRMDLAEFVEGGARDLLDVALALADVGGRPRDIALRATPTVDTPIGPIRYPRPITIRTTTG